MSAILHRSEFATPAATPVDDVDVGQFFAARRRASGILRRPRLRDEIELNDILECRITTCIDEQVGGSHHVRSLSRLMALSAEQRKRGIVVASPGDLAHSCAVLARRIHIGATVVLPSGADIALVDRIRSLRTEVIQEEGGHASMRLRARRLATTTGATLVGDGDEADMVRGAGTFMLDVIQEAGLFTLERSVIVVPSRSGRLLAGVAVAAKTLLKQVKVVGVEVNSAPVLSAALRGEVSARREPSLAAPVPLDQAQAPALPVAICSRLVDQVYTVSEDAITNALRLAHAHGLRVNAMASLGLAAIIEHQGFFANRRVFLLITGSNMTDHQFAVLKAVD